VDARASLSQQLLSSLVTMVPKESPLCRGMCADDGQTWVCLDPVLYKEPPGPWWGPRAGPPARNISTSEPPEAASSRCDRLR